LHKNPRPFNDSKSNSLFNSVGELLDIEERMIAWEKDLAQSNYFKSVKEILIELLSPQITEIIINREGSDTAVNYFEFSDKGMNYPKRFSELASGYRSIISMVGDIIIRLSKNQKIKSNFKELSGIVLIDEIDLHLHPKWQKALVEKLTQIFPKIQFIASTHSPIPLLGAPVNTVVINVQRSEEKGITAEKLDIDFSTLTPNSILSSPIFGFEELVPVSKTDDDFVHTEKDFKKISEKQKTRKKIAKYLSPEKTDEFLKLLNDDSQ
jgi:predicted ATP-binding protein involved in virulence